MILNSTMSLVVGLDDPSNSQDPLWNVSWVDLDTNYFIPGAAVGDTNGTTEVEMVPAPTNPRMRQIKTVTVTNIDDVEHTIHVLVDDGVTSRAVASRTLQPAEEMFWSSETGWQPVIQALQITSTGTPTAALISYDPSADSNTSGPISVADALDDLFRDIRSLEDLVGGGDDSNSLDGTFALPATSITYDAGDTGDSNSTATTAQEALDDLYNRVRAILVTIAGLDATNIAYGSLTDSNSVPTTVGEALDDIYTRLIDLTARIVTLEAKTAYDIPYDSTEDSNSSPANVGDALDDIYNRVQTLENLVGGGDDSNSADGGAGSANLNDILIITSMGG